MLLIMLSAIQGWSTGTCNQRTDIHEKMYKLKFRNHTWEKVEGTSDLHSAQLQESSKNANSCRTWRRLWFLWWCRNTEAVLADSESSSDHPIWNQCIAKWRKHSVIQMCIVQDMLESWELDKHLLELLNPCFCAVGRADHVELQIGEKDISRSVLQI